MMVANKYRTYAIIGIDEFEDYTNETEFILKSEVDDVIDEIEGRVKKMVEILEKVEGIDIIDDVKRELDDLAKDLY